MYLEDMKVLYALREEVGTNLLAKKDTIGSTNYNNTIKILDLDFPPQMRELRKYQEETHDSKVNGILDLLIQAEELILN